MPASSFERTHVGEVGDAGGDEVLVEGDVVRERVGEDRGVGRHVVADAGGVDDGAEG